MSEPAVMLTPPKHVSGEPEYPAEGPPKLDLPAPWGDPPTQQGPEQEPPEPPTYEPQEPGDHSGIDPREHANPHHDSTGNEGRHDVGGSGDGSPHPSPKLGTVKCGGPNDCVEKCLDKGITCPAAYASHPYKHDNVCISGWLVTCKSYPIDPSQECHYRFPNGDYCKFFYYPSKPPICIYQGGQGGQDYPH